MANRINGVNNVSTYIRTTGTRLNNQFQAEIIKRSRSLSAKMQLDLNRAVNKGAVPFTQRSVLFFYKKRGATSVSSTIRIKDIQAKYLYDIIVKARAIDKIIPTSASRLDKYGNIAGLKKNLSSGRYKVVKSKNGKERLIDTSKTDTKKKTKRVIGLRERKQRHLIYDFYREADHGVRVIMSGIQGIFRVTR